MPAEIIVRGFETSNNMKVRVALGYKRIPYEFRSVDPSRRDELVRLSGQHLTPVMTHGDVVLADSGAILRYLDANFRDTPRLYGSSVAEQWAIEDWELFARAELAGPLMEVVHTKVTGGEVDDAMQARCEADFGTAASTLAAALDGTEWLVGEALTAADIHAAAVMFRVRAAEMFTLPDDVATIAPWIERVMAYDGESRVA